MTTAERILNRYAFVFYPANQNWLGCGLTWDKLQCRCVDKVQLNIACSMVDGLLGCEHDSRFSFNGNCMNDPLYHMTTEESTCDMPQFASCKRGGSSAIIDGLSYKASLPTFDAEVERREIIRHEESIVLYLALCLLKINRDTSLSRHAIFHFYFLKNQSAFSQYLCDFRNFIEQSSCLDEPFLLFHIQLIEFVLQKYASASPVDILGDVLAAMDENYFKTNYKCHGEVSIIKQQIKQAVVGLEVQGAPELILGVPLSSPDTTIISIMVAIATIIKGHKKWSVVEKSFGSIYNHLRRIVELQRRSNETRISGHLRKLNNILNQ